LLRTGNGGKYTSVMFEQFLEGEDIRHERTIPKSLQYNGVAELMNRTIVEMARSNMAHKFWGEALFTAVYFRN